jgi:hypothetical protein
VTTEALRVDLKVWRKLQEMTGTWRRLSKMKSKQGLFGLLSTYLYP